MNRLSWLIYAADVCDSLSILLCFFVTIGVVLDVVVAACAFGRYVDERDDWCAPRRIAVCGLALVFTLGLLVAAVPSRETVLAIAASEMGEAALETPVASKAMRALDAWLDRQVAPEGEVK